MALLFRKGDDAEIYRQLFNPKLTDDEITNALATEYGHLVQDADHFGRGYGESIYGAAHYAGIAPIEEVQDGTYRFRTTFGGAPSDVVSTLFEMSVSPDPTSAFGFEIESLTPVPPAWSAAEDYSFHRDGFVFPDSDSRLLTDEDMQFLGQFGPDEQKEVLGFMRNEIFAGHGNIFDTEKYRDFFSQFDWYQPTHKVDGSELNSYEAANVQFILGEEAELEEIWGPFA